MKRGVSFFSGAVYALAVVILLVGISVAIPNDNFPVNSYTISGSATVTESNEMEDVNLSNSRGKIDNSDIEVSLTNLSFSTEDKSGIYLKRGSLLSSSSSSGGGGGGGSSGGGSSSSGGGAIGIGKSNSGNENISIGKDEDYRKFAPSNLIALAVSNSTIELNWSDNSPHEDGFRIQMFTSKNGGWIEIAKVAFNVTTYTHKGLNEKTNYYYRVFVFRTVDFLLNGLVSNLVNATTLAKTIVCSDSDNGDYYVRGESVKGEIKGYDVCLDQIQLSESKCVNNEIMHEDYLCPEDFVNISTRSYYRGETGGRDIIYYLNSTVSISLAPANVGAYINGNYYRIGSIVQIANNRYLLEEGRVPPASYVLLKRITNLCERGVCIATRKPESVICNDSDNGNVFVKGIMKNATTTLIDICTNGDKEVIEYSCEFGGSIKYVKCENGCSDGACRTEGVGSCYLENSSIKKSIELIAASAKRGGANITLIEGRKLKYNDYVVIKSPNKERILQLIKIDIGKGSGNNVSFRDLSGEIFNFNIGVRNKSSINIDGYTFNVLVKTSLGANYPEYVNLTWGEGAVPGHTGVKTDDFSACIGDFLQVSCKERSLNISFVDNIGGKLIARYSAVGIDEVNVSLVRTDSALCGFSSCPISDGACGISSNSKIISCSVSTLCNYPLISGAYTIVLRDKQCPKVIDARSFIVV